MDESQQQHRTRSRLTADGQTSRRPRPVAGQRAAAKRAARPVAQVTQVETALVIQPTVPEPRQAGDIAEAVEAVGVEVVEPEVVEPESVETDDSSDSSSQGSDRESEPARARKRVRRTRTSRPRGSATRRAIVTAVLAVALIAALAVGAVFSVQYRDAIRTDHARTAALAAAERAAPVIFSYDYRHLDQDFSKAEQYLTGTFHDQYAKTTQTVVKPTALQYHGVVQATVAKPADGSAAAVSVVSAGPDQVVVLAFIDQSTTSTRVNGTQVDQNRVLLTLTHTSQGWLVSAVDAL